MRVFHVASDQFSALPELPADLPATGYLWIGSARREFEVRIPDLRPRGADGSRSPRCWSRGTAATERQ